MNKRILHISLFLSLASASTALAQQGIGTHTPHRSAALQIDSQNKGLLIPRMNLEYTEAIVNNNNIYTITAPTITLPVKGLLVYNQNDVTKIDGVTTTVIVPQGFYYYDGSIWNPISKSYLQNSAHTTISGNGSITEPYTVELKPATAAQLGGVKIGENIIVEPDGTISVNIPEDNNTTYTDGGGISLNGTEFSVPVTTSASSVANGNVITNVVQTADGIEITKAQIETTDTTYTDGGGISLNGTEFSVPVTTSASSVANGNVITNVVQTADGIEITKAQIETTDTKTKVIAGTNVTVSPTTDPVNTSLNTYTVSVATANTTALGVVKGGGNVNIAADGTLSVNTTNTGIGKTLTGNGITVTAGSTVGTSTSLANSVLADVTLGIANNAVTSDKIADATIVTVDLANKSVTAPKLDAGSGVANRLAVADASGNVTYNTISTSILTGAGNLTSATGDTSITVADGNGATLINTNIKVADLGISTGKLAADAVTNAKLADNAVQTENIVDGTIATIDLANDAVTADKINSDVAGAGLVQNTSGALDVKAVNGLKVDATTGTNGDAVKLGGPLTEATTIATTTENNLKITGLQTVAQSATDQIMVVSSDGTLKQAKAVMPKFFYAPAVYLETHDLTTGNLISNSTTKSYNLHTLYSQQFGWTGSATNRVKSTGATTIPTLEASQLEYFVTYFDSDVFEAVTISDVGLLQYKVKTTAKVTPKTFINVVFKVKD